MRAVGSGLFLVLFTSLLVGAAACAPTDEDRAKKIALQHFEGAVERGAVAELSQASIFGRFDNELFLFWQEKVLVERTNVEPISYRVTIPFWCSGAPPRGHPIRRMRRLAVNVVNWTVEGEQLVLDEELTPAHQAGAWAGLSLILPFLFVLLVFYTGDFSNLVAAMRHPIWMPIVKLLSTVLSGYVAYVCFGSILVAFLGAVFYVIGSRMLVALVSGALQVVRS